ncbi:MAG TPA: FAD/NAD(P)-binding oxidoreductase [Prolixibacteraceae bacterium]|nr:FAD/NAD(P)-binding oxidoreductase [Prolixibacteraceae bacterium]HPT31028.1 FAD/NAD(P)-binding oxidoreductase [Prolixibacteraceae bacterium]
MSRIIVLGAGIAGHTAAMVLKRKLGKKHEVCVISPNSRYQWIPSNIWIGIGQMTEKNVTFELAPVYKKQGIRYLQAKATAIYPEGKNGKTEPTVDFEYTAGDQKGVPGELEYDFLINATGPRLNFAATEGLGPDGFSESVCTYHHAAHAWEKLQEALGKMAKGEKQRFLIGTGHPMATCQGAAFEYALNVAFEINKRKLNHLAEITWISNEYELGDFGMGGAFIKKGGYMTSTKIFTESIMSEYGIKWIKRAGVTKLEKGVAHYQTLDGESSTIEFDFAMLIPAFAGVGLKAFSNDGTEITSSLFAPNGLMKVDANYTQKPFEEWSVSDWPSEYQSPQYKNLFAAGIAFAPPHTISKPMTNKNGLAIYPTAPRTGMPSGVMGKVVALNIVHRIKTGKTDNPHKASMGKMGAACIVSSGYGIRDGMAATMTVYPVVPDFEKYPVWGRDTAYTMGEPGLAGHWIKLVLHVMFIYKAKGYPFWWMVPE